MSSDPRKIIHIDMDAFFASVEQRDFPELRGKPVAVGGRDARGVIAAASYEARKFGVHSAQPTSIALRRCPNLIIQRHRFDVYRAASQQVMEILRSYSDLVEQLSIDEAYLDVTTNKRGIPSATLIARAIKKEIFEATGLTASAGISINKFVAKTASGLNKPDGITLIKPDQVEQFMEELPVEDFYGIGKVTAKKMQQMGIFKGLDLKQLEREALVRKFGKAGAHYYNIVRGIDEREVVSERARKSVSVENTFRKDISDEQVLNQALEELHQSLLKRIEKAEVKGRTVTIKFKDFDFTQHTRSKTLGFYTADPDTIRNAAFHLLYHPELPPKPIRLLGVGLHNLEQEVQLQPGDQLTFEF